MKNISDEELLKLFLETQKDHYFEKLYDRYSDKVYRKCMSFVKDTAQAEDFTHDIFLKVFLNMGNYKETAKFSTWLYSITYNFCVDKVRSLKKKAETALDENFDTGEDLDEAEEKEMEAVRLKTALEKVSVDERAILLMKYQDDLSIKEIADILNITESAVKMRLKRTKEKVRKVYWQGVAFWVLFVLKIMTDWIDKR